MEKETEVDISFVFDKFHQHISIPNNDKIIFSGKYGIGKSFFINSYFKEASVAAKYNVVELSPINYVVSSNEDIFELIKVDIIKHLFTKGDLKFKEVTKKLPVLSTLKQYAKKHLCNL